MLSAKRAYCVLSATFLVYCAGVQFNDPDPVRWVVAYGSAALFALSCLRIRWPAWVVGSLSLLCAALGASLYWSSGPVTDWLAEEVGREVMGLCLVALIMVGLLWARPEKT